MASPEGASVASPERSGGAWTASAVPVPRPEGSQGAEGPPKAAGRGGCRPRAQRGGHPGGMTRSKLICFK